MTGGFAAGAARRRQSGMITPASVIMLIAFAALGSQLAYERIVMQTAQQIQRNANARVRADQARIVKNLIGLSTIESGNVTIPPPFVAVSGIGNGGGALPTQVPGQSDPWGNPYVYCPAKLGQLSGVGNRIAIGGAPTATTIVLAVISGGPNRQVETSCSQALANQAEGDDMVMATRHADLSRLGLEFFAGQHGNTLLGLTVACGATGKQFLPNDPKADTNGCV